MSTSIGAAALDLGMNYSAFNSQLNSIAGKATGLVGGAFTKLGVIIAGAFATRSLINFGRECIGIASDLQEVQNVVNVTFGNMAGDIDSFAKSALKNFGMSELTAKKFASSMGAMLKSSGVSSNQMLDMSKRLTGLAGDMASFYNLSHDEAWEKIRSGISGETEPLKVLGINMSVANMEAYALSKGITKSWQSMTQAEQTLLRYNYLIKSTKDAQGDFTNTSGSWANQTRLLSEQWNIFKGTLGSGFINVLTPVVKWLNIIIVKLQIAAEYFKAFTEMIFGNAAATSSATGTVAESMGDMSAAANDVGSSVKKAGKAVKGSIAGFDQLNILTRNTAGSMDDIASGAASIDLGNISSPDLKVDSKMFEPFKTSLQTIKKLSAEVWSTMKRTFGPYVSTAIKDIKYSVIQLGAALNTFLETVWKLFKQAFLDVLKTQDFSTSLDNLKTTITNVGAAISNGTMAAAAFLTVINQATTNAFPNLSSGLTSLIGGFLNFRTTVLEVSTAVVKDGLDVLNKAIRGNSSHLVNIWTPAMKIAGDMMNVIGKVFGGVANTMKSAYDKNIGPLKTLFIDVFGTMIKYFDVVVNKWIYPSVIPSVNALKNSITPAFESIKVSVTGSVQAIIDILDEYWNGLLKPWIKWNQSTLIPVLAPIFTELGNKMGWAFGTAVKNLAVLSKGLETLLKFVRDVMKKDWISAWVEMGSSFENMWKRLVDVARIPVNSLIKMINMLFDKLNSIQIDLPSVDVPGIGKMGGGTIGFAKIPKLAEIPALAGGGLVSAPTLAMVGDNRNARVDPEVISPLSKLQDMIAQTIAQSMASYTQGTQQQDTTVVLKIGETELGKATIKAINSVQRQAGTTLLKV